MTGHYDHITADDSRCWCGPLVHEEEYTVSRELFPGIIIASLRKETVVLHFEAALAPRKHGRPRKPRSRLEV